jgi:cellulose binding protein with CBM2 domain/fibronectin type III domain protein
MMVVATLLTSAGALLAMSATRADAAPTPTPTFSSPPAPTYPGPTATPTPPTPTTPTPSTSAPAPGAPANLRVTAITPGSVTLSWTAGTGAVDSYSVNYLWAFNDVYWTQPVGNVTTATITSSIEGTGQYSFSVVARDAAGRTSSPSNYLTVVTPAGTTGDTTPPSAPTGLTVGDVTTSGVILTWSAATDNVGVTDYNVYEFDGWYTSRLLGPTNQTTYVAPFTGTTSPTGLRYYYVRAKDAAGNLSIASNLVSTPAPITPPPPTDPPTVPVTPACKVAYRSTAQWTGGFVAEVSLTNTGTTAVDGWVLTFPFGGDQKITSIWHATYTQNAANVTLTAAQWNRAIAPGATVTVGLIGTYSSSNTPPATAALNGAACTLA